jgi:hypothetical protein
MVYEQPLPFESPRFDRNAIFQCRVLLLELAGRLRGDPSVDPAGMALLQRLITDKGGPLYRSDADLLNGHSGRRSLAAELTRAIAALDPSPGL